MKNLIIMLALCLSANQSWADEAALEHIKVDTALPALARGVDDFMGNCHSCHNMKYVTYLDLAKLGIDKQKIDGWRGDQPMDSPINGLMTEEVAKQSFNMVPPDLSLMTKAREGGPDYVYSYLIGYYTSPDGVVHNHIFPATHMPDPLGMSTASDPAQKEQIKATAHDIVSFLSWAADPHAQERHRLGYYVIGYLVFLTFLLYLVKRQIWARLD